MELTDLEIGILIDHYDHEIYVYGERMIRIAEDQQYDADLRCKQLDRLQNKVRKFESRIAELKGLRK